MTAFPVLDRGVRPFVNAVIAFSVAVMTARAVADGLLASASLTR